MEALNLHERAEQLWRKLDGLCGRSVSIAAIAAALEGVASDFEQVQARCEALQHDIDALNVCENCAPLDEGNQTCPLCKAKEYRERDDAAFRQTIGELEAERDALSRENARLREALEHIANSGWEYMQDKVRQSDDSDSVTLEGDYASDARYHYPYRMTVLRRFAKDALTPASPDAQGKL